MKPTNQKSRIDKMLDDMPQSLERVILRILTFHIGKQNAIKNADILKEIHDAAFLLNVSDKHASRTVRSEMANLRKQGIMACYGDSGYYLAANASELNEYQQRQLTSRIKDLSDQNMGLTKAGRELFGDGFEAEQGELF